MQERIEVCSYDEKFVGHHLDRQKSGIHTFVFLPEPIRKRFRIPMSAILEQELQETARVKKLTLSMNITYQEMQAKPDQKKIRVMQRELWQLIGQFEKRLDPNALQKVNNIFEKLDIVPKDYHYPELYDLKGNHRY